MKPSENPEPNGSPHTPGQGTGPIARLDRDSDAVGRVPSPGGPELQWEDRLRRTTFCPPAPAWRNEILSAAADARKQTATNPPTGRFVTTPGSASRAQLLVAWLRGIPTEWTAAAALWLLILAINSASSSPGSSGSTIASVASTEQRDDSIQQALAYRRQLLSELQGPDAINDLPRAARPEADRPKRQLNFLGTNGPAATSA